MADSAFVLADIDKLVQFEKKSDEAIKEFDAIKEKFNDINTTLLKKWKGEIMYEAFKDATVSTREKGETDETAGWSFSDETYTATLDWKEK